MAATRKRNISKLTSLCHTEINQYLSVSLQQKTGLKQPFAAANKRLNKTSVFFPVVTMNPLVLPLKRQSERKCTCHALTLLYLEKDDHKKSLKSNSAIHKNRCRTVF